MLGFVHPRDLSIAGWIGLAFAHGDFDFKTSTDQNVY